MSGDKLIKVNTSIYWQNFIDSTKTLPLPRRLCLYPYGYIMTLLTEQYAKAMNRWESKKDNPADKHLTWLESAVRPNRAHIIEYYKQRHSVFLRELEACCDEDARRPLNDLMRDQTTDITRYCRSLSRLSFSEKLLAIPYATINLIFLVFLRMMAELCLAGKSKEFLTNLYTNVSTNQTARFSDPREIQDMAVQTKPIVLLGLYAAPLTAVILIAKQLVNDTIALFRDEPEILPEDCLRFRQNIDRKKENGPAAFYLSPVFGWTMLFIFATGIPGLISFWLYGHLGIDPLLGFPSHDKGFFSDFAIVGLYITSLAWCLMSLFFTGYFTYLCNFGSTEYDIEVYPDLIKQLPIKGWAADILFFSLFHPLRRLFWRDVSTVSFKNNKDKLKLIADKADNPFWRAFLKFDSLFDRFWHKFDIHNEYLEIATPKDSINIRLWELSHKERAQIFYCLRKYAPSIYLDSSVQEALVGSAVLRDPRYTEIWFDILTRSNQIDDDEVLGPGRQLREGKLTITKKLTSGGQANIYLAHDTKGKNVVLKEFQLTPGESLDSLVESAGAFESESSILSQLDHPGIVRLYDLFIQGSRVYLVLEHVEGHTLRELVKAQGSLDEAMVLDLAKQMCGILAYLHGRTSPIVHRDFTPDNLIVQTDGKLKLIDFSVAQGHKSERNNCAGKHAYTPPEQFRGEACPQSDIYALGATLYFLLTGKDPEPISQSSATQDRPDISIQLNQIIEKCTGLDLKDRYESIVWLNIEIGSLLTQESTDHILNDVTDSNSCSLAIKATDSAVA